MLLWILTFPWLAQVASQCLTTTECSHWVYAWQDVQGSIYQTQGTGSYFSDIFVNIILIFSQVNEKVKGTGEVKAWCHYVIHRLEECLGYDGGCTDGAKTREEEQGGGDEACCRYQQEEQLWYHVVWSSGPFDVMTDDTHGNTS